MGYGGKGRIERAFGPLQDRMVKSLPREGGGAAAGRGILDYRGERMAARVHHSRIAVERPIRRIDGAY
jgi:hypothetical protein